MKFLELSEINPFVRFAKLMSYIPVYDESPQLYAAKDWRLFMPYDKKVTLHFEGGKYILSKNTIALIAPDVPYRITCEKQNGVPDYNILLLNVNFDMTMSYRESTTPVSPTDPKINSYAFDDSVTKCFYPYVIFTDFPASANAHLVSLLTEFTVTGELSEIKSSLLLKLTLLELFEAKTSAGTGNKKIVMDIVSYVHANISKHFSIKEMAAELFFHPFYLSKIFSDNMNVSLHDFIMNERLSHAKELLLESDLSVEETASMSGFVNTSHFCKAFLKTFRVSPAKFRKINLQVKSDIHPES